MITKSSPRVFHNVDHGEDRGDDHMDEEVTCWDLHIGAFMWQDLQRFSMKAKA